MQRAYGHNSSLNGINTLELRTCAAESESLTSYDFIPVTGKL